MDYAYNKSLFIDSKMIDKDRYVYGGTRSAVWIKLSDEATLRRKFEIGPDEPMNFRYETQYGSVTIIE